MHLTLLYVVFAYLAEQNSKLVDLKLKNLLEAQPQVANSLSSAAQKAVTDSSEQDIKVSFDSCFCLSACMFQFGVCTLWGRKWFLIKSLPVRNAENLHGSAVA